LLVLTGRNPRFGQGRPTPVFSRNLPLPDLEGLPVIQEQSGNHIPEADFPGNWCGRVPSWKGESSTTPIQCFPGVQSRVSRKSGLGRFPVSRLLASVVGESVPGHNFRTLRALAGGKTFSRYCPIELAVAENTLFALPPINRSVPTTITKMTASITAYSAISCPSSCDHSLPRQSVTFAPPRRLNSISSRASPLTYATFLRKGREPKSFRRETQLTRWEDLTGLKRNRCTEFVTPERSRTKNDSVLVMSLSDVTHFLPPQRLKNDCPILAVPNRN
jgi:hypothetical protein